MITTFYLLSRYGRAMLAGVFALVLLIPFVPAQEAKNNRSTERPPLAVILDRKPIDRKYARPEHRGSRRRWAPLVTMGFVRCGVRRVDGPSTALASSPAA